MEVFESSLGSKKYPAKILPGNSREEKLVGSTI
jgi:hypothetical protein